MQELSGVGRVSGTVCVGGWAWGPRQGCVCGMGGGASQWGGKRGQLTPMQTTHSPLISAPPCSADSCIFSPPYVELNSGTGREAVARIREQGLTFPLSE